MFYGAAAVIRGSLMVRSDYIPRAIGAAFIIGGVGFILKNVLSVAAPQYDQSYVLLPMFIAMLAWTLWAITTGVNRWPGEVHRG